MRATILLLLPLLVTAQDYDLVLANGRVLDPATNLDAVRHVGIRAGEIAAVSATPLRGGATVDASGLVVAPGFIDLHAHGQLPENYRLQAQDGVTTALELEIGVNPVQPWYAERGRGRDAGCPTRPARTRAGATNAHGSYLGFGHVWRLTRTLG